jgi:hypothetical protein
MLFTAILLAAQAPSEPPRELLTAPAAITYKTFQTSRGCIVKVGSDGSCVECSTLAASAPVCTATGCQTQHAQSCTHESYVHEEHSYSACSSSRGCGEGRRGERRGLFGRRRRGGGC